MLFFTCYIAYDLDWDQEEKLIDLLKENKEAIGWTLEDIKWLGYPTQIVPKKTGITVIRNDKNELVPTRIQSMW